MRFFILAMAVLSMLSIAQTESIDSKYSQLHEGKAFVIKATPAGKKLDLLVTGREAATLEMKDVGLVAKLHQKGRQYVLTPVRNRNQFSLELPVEGESQIDLDVKYRNQTERFRIPVNQAP